MAPVRLIEGRNCSSASKSFSSIPVHWSSQAGGWRRQESHLICTSDYSVPTYMQHGQDMNESVDLYL